jgi:hypothetical protein
MTHCPFRELQTKSLLQVEDAFVTALESLERPDLAALVRGGKKYIPFVIGTTVS